MPVATIQDAAYGLPTQLSKGALYGRAILNTPGLQDLWTFQDAASPSASVVTGLTMSITGGFGYAYHAPSLFGQDPKGYSLRLWQSGIATTGAYTLPAAGTLELVTDSIGLAGDSCILGNWNGSGVMIYGAASGVIRCYMGGSNVSYSLTSADIRSPVLHLATTWNGTTQYLYLNGRQVQSQLVGSPAAAGALAIGQYSGTGNTNRLMGRAAWVAVYSRALSGNEIASHAARIVNPS